MDCAEIALAILAAGRSARFGRPKLTMTLGGDLLGCVSARRLAPLPFCTRIAIVAPDQPILAHRFKQLGFSPVVTVDQAAGLSHSLALAIAAVLPTTATGVLVCLADMPNISSDHILKVIAAALPDRIAASSLGEVPMPPALFPRRFWPQMAQLSGDTGARHMLLAAHRVHADEWTLRDIDTPQAYDEVNRAYPPARELSQDPS